MYMYIVHKVAVNVHVIMYKVAVDVHVHNV